MPEAQKTTRPTPYASCEDFRRVFDEDMNSLYRLAFLLTADQQKAEQCFVSGLDDVVKGNPVFKEWARSWARRAVILNAVRVINPRPADGNGRGRSSFDPVNNDGKALPAEKQAEIAAVLELDAFERFVYVITVLEHYSDLGRSSFDPVNNDGKALPAEKQAEIAAVLELDAFERFVYVITVLEHYSD